jgi:hypothetical protein
MVAQVHAGEMIVPRDIAERLRGGGGFGGGGTAPAAGGGGGETTIVYVTVEGDYYGVDRSIDELGDRLAAAVKGGRVKRTVAA